MKLLHGGLSKFALINGIKVDIVGYKCAMVSLMYCKLLTYGIHSLPEVVS